MYHAKRSLSLDIRLSVCFFLRSSKLGDIRSFAKDKIAGYNCNIFDIRSFAKDKIAGYNCKIFYVLVKSMAAKESFVTKSYGK